MLGGTQVEERRERRGVCKSARQGNHLGSLRLSSSAQGPRWGREGGGEGEEEQPLLRPGARGGSFSATQLWATDCSTRSPGAARLGQHLSFYSKPPRLPLGGPFPAPRAISQAQRDDFRFLEGVCCNQGTRS